MQSPLTTPLVYLRVVNSNITNIILMMKDWKGRGIQEGLIEQPEKEQNRKLHKILGVNNILWEVISSMFTVQPQLLYKKKSRIKVRSYMIFHPQAQKHLGIPKTGWGWKAEDFQLIIMMKQRKTKKERTIVGFK